MWLFYVQDVIEVENTVSPQMLRGAPKDLPEKVSPDLRCSTAGMGIGACVAKPRKRDGIRGIERMSMAKGIWFNGQGERKRGH